MKIIKRVYQKYTLRPWHRRNLPSFTSGKDFVVLYRYKEVSASFYKFVYNWSIKMFQLDRDPQEVDGMYLSSRMAYVIFLF